LLRLYLHLSVILILLFTLCGFALSALGSTKPIHPALRGFVEGCEGLPQPCWYGIALGSTTFDEAREVIRSGLYYIQLNYQSGTYLNILADDCVVQLMPQEGRMWMDCHDDNPTVGDMMDIWGAPRNILIMGCDKNTFLYGDGRIWGFSTVREAQSNSYSFEDPVSEIYVMQDSYTARRVLQDFPLFWNVQRLDIRSSGYFGCTPPRTDDVGDL
jgi:hypothetical protein